MKDWANRNKLWLVLVVALLFMAADYPEKFRADSANGMYNPTLSDSVNETYPARGFFVESAGILKVTTADGSVHTMSLLAGQPVPLRVARFWSGTTTIPAADINAYKD